MEKFEKVQKASNFELVLFVIFVKFFLGTSKNLKKNEHKPLQWLVSSVILLWCRKKYGCSFDARGCDTLGCIATQLVLVFLWS